MVSRLLFLVFTVSAVSNCYANKVPLRFSNTQKWGNLKRFHKCENHLLRKDWRSSYLKKLLPPPLNNSKETKEELRYLKKLVDKRDRGTLIRIKAERNISGWKMGRYNVEDLIIPGEENPVSQYFSIALRESLCSFVYFKKYFDRVRPTKLDRSLKSTILVPLHPAYPSGHSSEANLVASLLSKLSPKEARSFRASARSIAKNREIAGVHYPSDSKAGEILAGLIIKDLFKSKFFQKKFDKALEYWNQGFREDPLLLNERY